MTHFIKPKAADILKSTQNNSAKICYGLDPRDCRNSNELTMNCIPTKESITRNIYETF